MKNNHLWQLTLPITVIAIFGIRAFTIIKMSHGEYSFEVEIPGWVKLFTEIRKDGVY